MQQKKIQTIPRIKQVKITDMNIQDNWFVNGVRLGNWNTLAEINGRVIKKEQR